MLYILLRVLEHSSCQNPAKQAGRCARAARAYEARTPGLIRIQPLPHSFPRSSLQINMRDTPDQSLLARSQGLSAATNPRPWQRAVAPENLLRLLRPGSAPTIPTSPDNNPTATRSLSNDPAHTAERHAPAPSLRTASAPQAPRGETMTPSTSPSIIDSQSSTYAFAGWRAHLSSEPPLDRVGRLEVLNDVSGRELRVFRKSPCPPRRRNSCPVSTDDAPE